MNKILHIDMDAFFPSIEQRDNPELKGKPVIVGGSPKSRGVVASCSYEARKFGVHSAMSSAHAQRLCPDGIFLPPRIDAYREVSAQLLCIFHEYSDLVEPVSLDEAYIDVTVNKLGIGSATAAARDIRGKIKSITGLTASAGVSYNKFLAKTASDFNKPDGLTVIRPEDAESFLEALPIGKFYGVGKVTEKRFLSMGIKSGSELKALGRETMLRLFGKAGGFYYDIVRGIDNRPVEPFRKRQSAGREHTFPQDMDSRDEMLAALSQIAEEVSHLLRRKGLSGRTVTLKVRYSDFISVTRSISLADPVSGAAEILRQASYLLNKTEAEERKVRLLGISVSGFDEGRDSERQLSLPFWDTLSKAAMRH